LNFECYGENRGLFAYSSVIARPSEPLSSPHELM